jgi:DNA-binding MarR family transcriptional regulator
VARRFVRARVRPPAGRRRAAGLAPDGAARAVLAFVELIAASTRSPRQRERLARAAGSPVTPAGLALLRLVQDQGPLAPSALAARLSLDVSTVSRQLRPLERAGLVERRPDPSDARAAQLRISPRGRALLERIREVSLNDFTVAMADWPAADREQLAALLGRLRQALLEVHADASGWSVGKGPRVPDRRA